MADITRFPTGEGPLFLAGRRDLYHRGITGTSVAVELTGWDRAMNGRRRVEFDAKTIEVVSVADRSSLEIMIDHRALGCGTHDGSKRPGRRRIGTMIGPGFPSNQFWAVRKGPGSSQLVVLDLIDNEFVRAVLDVEEPESFLAATRESIDGRTGD